MNRIFRGSSHLELPDFSQKLGLSQYDISIEYIEYMGKNINELR